MKKLFLLFIAVFVFILTGCTTSYSKDSFKGNLEKNGYTVDVNPTIANLDKTKLEGLQTVLYAYNKDDIGILLFIFDSTDNVSKLTEGSTVSETVSMIMRWGKDHAKSGNNEFGSVNNVLYSGDKDARKAAGIRLATD